MSLALTAAAVSGAIFLAYVFAAGRLQVAMRSLVSLGQTLLVAPDLQFERPFDGIKATHKRSGALPPAFLIEAGGPVISNCAC